MEILQYPNKILTTKCPPYDQAGFAKDLIDVETMTRMMMSISWCAGIAAPQVGISRRFFVMRDGKNFVTCFDPVIKNHGAEIEMAKEGCMSLKGVFVPVPRWKWITASYFNKKGLEVEVIMAGMKARAYQHLVDNLNGLLIIKTEGEDGKEFELVQ